MNLPRWTIWRLTVIGFQTAILSDSNSLMIWVLNLYIFFTFLFFIINVNVPRWQKNSPNSPNILSWSLITCKNSLNSSCHSSLLIWLQPTFSFIFSNPFFHSEPKSYQMIHYLKAPCTFLSLCLGSQCTLCFGITFQHFY